MSIRQYLFILFILLITGCTTPRYVILDNGERINCSAAPSLWWGEKGQQPTSKEVEELCSCFDWVISRQ